MRGILFGLISILCLLSNTCVLVQENVYVSVPSYIIEDDTESYTCAVSISEPKENDIIITLDVTSGGYGRINMPATVTITSGEYYKAFDITTIDNEIPGDTVTVTVSASYPLFESGSKNMTIIDNDDGAFGTPTPTATPSPTP
ncbi:MAG: hypothetical protein JW969_03890 [Spirochaetales bacterium]|nr:hypothetical protein [Spirochaetales bacterium]